MGEMGKERKRKLSSYLQPQPQLLHNISSPTPTYPTPYPAHQFPILFLPGVGKAQFDDEGNRRKRRLWQGRKVNASVSAFEAVGKLVHLFLGCWWVGGTVVGLLEAWWVRLCGQLGGWGWGWSLRWGPNAFAHFLLTICIFSYLTNNNYLFSSNKIPIKSPKNKTKKGMVYTYCDWKKLVLLWWHWHGPPLLPVLYSATALAQEYFCNIHPVILISFVIIYNTMTFFLSCIVPLLWPKKIFVISILLFWYPL